MSRRSQQTKKQQKISPKTSSSKDEGELSKSLGTSAEESGMRSLGAESVTMESPPKSGSSQFPRKDSSESNTTTEEQSESVTMESPAKGGSSQFPRKDSSESKTTTEEQSESLGAGYKRLGTARSPIKKSIQKVKGLAASAVQSLHGFASSRRGKTPPAKDKSGQGHSKKAFVLLPKPADLDRPTLKSALSQFYDHFHASDAAGTAHYSKRTSTSSEQDPERPEESVEVVVLGCSAGEEDAEEEAAPEGAAQEATAEEEAAEDDVLVRRYSNLSASTGSGSSRKTGSTKSAYRFNFQARSSPESSERRHSPPSAGPSSRGASSHSASDFGRGKSRAKPNLRRATEKSHPRPVKAADRKSDSSTDSSKSLQIFELCEVKDGSLAKRRLSRERDSILEELPEFLEPSCRESPDGVKRPAVGGHDLRPPPLPSRYVDDSEVAGTSRCSDPLSTLGETYDSIQSLSAPTKGSQPGETRSEAWSDTSSSTASRSTITRLMKRFYLYFLKKFTRAEPTVNDFFNNLANCIQNQVRSSPFIPPAARYLCLIGLNFFLVVRFPFADYWFYCGASEKSGVSASRDRGSGSVTGVTETTKVMNKLDCIMTLLPKKKEIFPRIDELGPIKVKLILSFEDEKACMSATGQADANRSNLNAPDPSDADEKSGEDIHTDEEPGQTD